MKRITKSPGYAWILVFCYSVLGMTCPAAVTQYSMVVNELASAMHMTARPILLADSFRAVLLVLAMFLSSFIYRKLGLRKTIILGLSFQIGSQFLIPLAINAQSVPLLFIFKGMQGLNAIAFPLYISTITLWISEQYKGLATAIFNGSFIAGGGIGAWITGKMVPLLGWESSFLFLGTLTLVFAVPALFMTHDKPELATAASANATSKSSAVYGPILKNPISWFLVISLIANTWVGQAVNVDMSVYLQDIGYNYSTTGMFMLITSIVTVVSSIMAGGVSDRTALKLHSPVKSRCIIMSGGYLLSAVSAALFPLCSGNLILAVFFSSAMIFGVSWAAGVFWAIPSELFSQKENVTVTAFCSSASNIPNPVAPAVVGVLLGGNGYWTAGWMTCALMSLVSMIASLMIYRYKK